MRSSPVTDVRLSRMRARFDKVGRRLPDTGRGCGCRLCEEANAPRYERRTAPGDRQPAPWGPVRRAAIRLMRQALPQSRRHGLAG